MTKIQLNNLKKATAIREDTSVGTDKSLKRKERKKIHTNSGQLR